MVGAYQLGLPVRLTLSGTRETRFAAARDSCLSFFDAAALAGFPERLGFLGLSDFFLELLGSRSRTSSTGPRGPPHWRDDGEPDSLPGLLTSLDD